MRLTPTLQALSIALLLANTLPAHANPPALTQAQFETPAAAADALAGAVRSGSPDALLTVVGPQSRRWLFSGDPVADRNDWQAFLAAYERQHAFTTDAAGQTRLTVGDTGWTFPAPIVRQGNAWVFDAVAGREELINRRIGRNELDAIQTLLALVDAQRDYAAADADGNGLNDYARRFVSSAGKRDGLYWPVQADAPPSPLGPLFAKAARQGYGQRQGADKPPTTVTYHGYTFRLLTRQCQSAPGGAYSYLVNDRLFGGFAIVAYPATYGVSGIMSFQVNHDGTVYEKNAGKTTATDLARQACYNPGDGWRPVKTSNADKS